ncbi:hypothetical protein ACTFIW_004885 [Dictyostelium discoideum]
MDFFGLDTDRLQSGEQHKSVLGSNDLKFCLETVVEISNFIKTSLGPKSGDKLIVDENGNIIVTNDGYSIIKYLSKSSKFDEDDDEDNQDNNIINLESSHHNNNNNNKYNNNNNNNNNSNNNKNFSKSSSIDRKRFQTVVELLIDCCKTQERLYGDGTTSVLVLIGSFCSSALKLIFEKSIPPHIVSNAFQNSLNHALKLLNNNYYLNVNINNENNNNENNNEISLEKVTESSLLSKSISFYKEELSKLSIESVKLIYSYYKRVELKRIKVITIQGSTLEDCRLIKGCLIKRFFSHENMPKTIDNASIIVLSFPLEFPKPKTNFNISINSIDQLNEFIEIKSNYYQSIKDAIKLIKGLKCVVCQWGIDQEINQFLYQFGISAISWVGGDDLERISISSGANIINDLDSLLLLKKKNDNSDQFIGYVGQIKELVMGNDSSSRYIEFSDCKNSSTVTILVRGGSKEMCDETAQCLRDSIHIVGGCLKDPRIVPSGGSTELYLFNQFKHFKSTTTTTTTTMMMMAIKSWSESLLTIPITLLENGGYDCQKHIIKLIQIHSDNDFRYYGVNINNNSSSSSDKSNKEFDLYNCSISMDTNQNIIQDMKFKSWELLNLKKSILKLATETTCMLLSMDAFICL